MNLTAITGCVRYDLTVDGTSEINLTDEKRIEVLSEISKYIASLDIQQFAKVISNELAMYDSEEDLEYISDFYQSLIDNKIIQPLEQFPKEWNHKSEWLAKQLRSYVSKYIRDLSPNELNSLLWDFIMEFGDYKYLYQCDQCGDVVEQYTLTI